MAIKVLDRSASKTKLVAISLRSHFCIHTPRDLPGVNRGGSRVPIFGLAEFVKPIFEMVDLETASDDKVRVCSYIGSEHWRQSADQSA